MAARSATHGRRTTGAGSSLTRLQKIDTSRLSHQVRPRIKPRGLPPALEDHLVWASRDPSEATHLGRELLGPHRLTVTDERPQDFFASYHAVRLRDVTLGYLDYTTEVRVEAPELPSSVLVLVPMSGTSIVHTGATTAQATPITAVLPRLDRPAVIECDRQAPHLVVRIERQALLVHLSRILGRPLGDPLIFDVQLDLSAVSANRWNFAIQMLHAELFDAGSLLHQGIGAGQLEEFIMSSLLYAHRSNYSTFLTRPGQGVEHRATRAAKDFVEMHLAEPLTVADIAAAAGVSERTLQSAFRSELATTPIAYLKARRLERARADLADAATADAVGVTTIAARWGFGHLGRFAAEYRARFGESPSQTLRG